MLVNALDIGAFLASVVSLWQRASARWSSLIWSRSWTGCVWCWGRWRRTAWCGWWRWSGGQSVTAGTPPPAATCTSTSAPVKHCHNITLSVWSTLIWSGPDCRYYKAASTLITNIYQSSSYIITLPIRFILWSERDSQFASNESDQTNYDDWNVIMMTQFTLKMKFDRWSFKYWTSIMEIYWRSCPGQTFTW